MILCIANNKAYIGHSKNIHTRWSKHKWDLSRYSHSNQHLQNCFNKYGFDGLSFLVLENTSNLGVREAYWLNLIDEPLRLNMAEIDLSSGKLKFVSKISPRKGVVLSKEEKLKMSKAAKSRSVEAQKRISQARWTMEHRVNLSRKRRALTDAQVEEIKLKIELGYRKCYIEKEYSISESIFYKIKKGSYLS